MERIKGDSFTVTLQSNLCKEDYPFNNNFKFTNRLPRDVNVKGYEVGLVDLYHYDTYQRPLSRDEIQWKNSDNVPFFDLLQSENEVTVIQSSSSGLQITKYTSRVSAWIILFNRFLETYKFGAHLTAVFNNGVFTTAKIEYNPPNNSVLILSSQLMRFLGFTSSVFEKGEHPSDKEVDLEYFNSLELLGTMGHIRWENVTSETVLLNQIQGKYEISELLAEMVVALNNENHNVSFIGTENDTKVEFSIEPNNKRVIFSKFLNNYLGLPDNFYFQGKGTISIPPEIIDPTGRELLLLDSLSSSKIIVTTDIIGNQIYGEQEIPLLAVFNRINIKDSEVQHRMNPIVYKEVERQTLSEIGITVVSDTGEFTSFSRNPTTLTLHFRKIKPWQT